MGYVNVIWLTDANAMTLLALRCVYRAVFHALSIFFADDLVEMPPPPVTSQHVGEHGE